VNLINAPFPIKEFAMSTPSDLTQLGPALVYALVNAANSAHLTNGPLSPANATVGAPTALSSDPSGKNTAVTLTAIIGQGYTGTVNIDYNRLDIQADVFAVLAPAGATLVNAAFATNADLLAPLNAAYNLNLQPSDLETPAAAIDTSALPMEVTLNIALTSLTYLGNLVVTITAPQVALASVITDTSMDGLTGPQVN
jgi:hypothetical protein